MKALIRDAATGLYLRFEDSRRLISASSVDGVWTAIEEAEAAREAGYWLAGFVAYEAAPAFDSALTVRPEISGRLPLLCFGVFNAPSRLRFGTAPETGARPDLQPELDGEAYRERIAQILSGIREGDIYQVNLTHRLTGRSVLDPYGLFLRLARDNAATYAAYLDLGDGIHICSASPELFFRHDGGRLTSRPMKGTLSRSEPRPPALLRDSEKDRAENLMIVDMVRNDMARVSTPGSVRVPECWTIEAYPTVWQMTSLVESHSRAPLSHVFRAMFPAASITGAPKAAAMHFIRRLETLPRGVYTGSIGFAAPGGPAQFNVAIRTAVVDTRDDSLTYGVGGGVVADSTAEGEYEESLAKARVLTVAAPRFDLLETMRWEPAAGFLRLPLHLERLQTSGEALGFVVNRPAIRRHLEESAEAFPAGALRVRLTVDRGGSPGVTWRLIEGDGFPDRACVTESPVCVPSSYPLLGHKTTRRELYEALRATCPRADDVLMWNERGEMTESCVANLFVEMDGLLVTPPVTCGLLPGVLRGELLAAGRAREGVIPRSELGRHPIWLGNSVRGLYPATLGARRGVVPESVTGCRE